MIRIRSTVTAGILATIMVLATLGGCQKKGEEVPLGSPQNMEETAVPALPNRIEIPDDVAGQYKAVVIEVTDKDTSSKNDFTVNIGETASLGNSGLSILVEAFLPAFQMMGDVYTTSSAEPVNPAAKVKIRDENGSLLFDRWLFAMYPSTHPFDHDRYAVTLTGYVENK